MKHPYKPCNFEIHEDITVDQKHELLSEGTTTFYCTHCQYPLTFDWKSRKGRIMPQIPERAIFQTMTKAIIEQFPNCKE